MYNPNFSKPIKLGCGAYGTVFSNKKDEAVKITKMDSWDKLQSTLREIHALKQLQPLKKNAFVDLKRIKYYKKKMHIFMNRADGNLSSISFKDVSAATIYSYSIQMFEGLFALRQHRLFHRDIKPENILIDLRKSKLYYCDFGLSRQFHDDDVEYGTGYIVTRWYRSPELLQHQKKHKRKANLHYTEKMDVWSVGAIMYEMIIRKVLAPGKTLEDALQLIHKHVGQLDFKKLTENKQVNEKVAKCLIGCLKIDPNSRFNCARALHALGKMTADEALQYQDNLNANKIEYTVDYALPKPYDSKKYELNGWKERSKQFAEIYRRFPSQKKIIAYAIVIYDETQMTTSLTQHLCDSVIYSALVLGSYYNNKSCHDLIKHMCKMYDPYSDTEHCWDCICMFTERVTTKKVSLWEKGDTKSFTTYLKMCLEVPKEENKNKRIKINH